MSQVSCLDYFVQCLIGCQPYTLVVKATHGKEHAQCVCEVFGVTLLRPAAVVSAGDHGQHTGGGVRYVCVSIRMYVYASECMKVCVHEFVYVDILNNG